MAKKLTVRQALRRSGLFNTAYEMEQAIKEGRVTFNNKPVPNLAFHFSKDKRIFLDGKPVKPLKKRYFIFNKPAQTSCQKNEQYKYIVDFLDLDEQTKKTLFPVGRLDVPTTGLIIITNDGELSHNITEPDKKIPKTYKVLLNQELTSDMKKELEKGVTITVDAKPYQTQPSRITILDKHTYTMTITEGKHRQVRKMFEAVGNRVMALCRIQIGKLELGDLQEGKAKELKKEEINQITIE